MQVTLTLVSQQLDKETVQRLLQAIRDCEQKYFPDKEISMLIEVPELSEDECKQILTSIKPPYKYGPFIKPRDG